MVWVLLDQPKKCCSLSCTIDLSYDVFSEYFVSRVRVIQGERNSKVVFRVI